MVIQAIASAGKISIRQILRARRAMTKGELMAIAEELEAEGKIRIEKESTGGRPTVKLVWGSVPE